MSKVSPEQASAQLDAGPPAESTTPASRSFRQILLRQLTERLQQLSWISGRVGHVFASRQQLHPTDFRALTAIYQNERAGHPMTGRDLTVELDLTPAAITYVVDRLVASGHVARERDPGDGRRLLLRYSEPGREVAMRFCGPLSRHPGHHPAARPLQQLFARVDRVQLARRGHLRPLPPPFGSGLAGPFCGSDRTPG